MPLGILESFACGLPVVATNVVGNKDVITNDEVDFLFDLDHPNKASDYLIKLSANKNIWFDISNNVRAKASHKYSVILAWKQNFYIKVF